MANYIEMFNAYNCAELNDERVHHEVMKLLEEKQGLYNTDEVKKQLLRGVELTTLTVTDSQDSVLAFTEKVNSFYDEHQDLPPLDFVIRTSGELRLSNFMMYQASYAEFYFPEVLFPDFNEEEFDKAIEIFNKRNRRFGGVKNESKSN